MLFTPLAVKTANLLKLKTEKSRYIGNALTDCHEIRQGDAKTLSHPCALAMRPFPKLL